VNHMWQKVVVRVVAAAHPHKHYSVQLLSVWDFQESWIFTSHWQDTISITPS